MRLSVSVYDYSSHAYMPDLLAQAYIQLTNDSLKSFWEGQDLLLVKR